VGIFSHCILFCVSHDSFSWRMLPECSSGRFQYLAFALCVLFCFLACRPRRTNMCTVKQCTFNLNCAEHLATMPARLCFIRFGSQTVCLHSVHLLGGVEIVKAQEVLMVSLPSSFNVQRARCYHGALCGASHAGSLLRGFNLAG
jgi:hypothetical protein